MCHAHRVKNSMVVSVDLPALGPNELEVYISNPLGFSKMEPFRSEIMRVGDFSFRLLVFPAGNMQSSHHVAAYVECVPREDADERWYYGGVRFQVMQLNFRDLNQSIVRQDSHSFSKSSLDRGWPDFAELKDLNGWLDESGRMCFRATAAPKMAETIYVSSDYDCRKETCFVGLKNHGATCYLNGLLQSLYHLGGFRKIVYEADPEFLQNPSPPQLSRSPSSGSESEIATPSERPSLPLALQTVFLEMENSVNPVPCRELIRAFGWDSLDAFTQHDAQELQRILFDRLEENLKGTKLENSLKYLFQGKVESFVECLDIPFISKKEEAFYDLPLAVRDPTNKPLSSVEESLKEFVASETLEGENAYAAEGFGKQRARKGVRFLDLPPVLNLQLKRFHFDIEKLEMVKLNDFYTFPSILDFADKSIKYRLHTVLVHAGDINSGHYYAFVRPSLNNQWYKFDDDLVTKCTEFAAINDNFGGHDRVPIDFRKSPSFKLAPRNHSAYMLVYVREDKLEEILASPETDQTALRAERRELRKEKRKAKMEEALISVSRKDQSNSNCQVRRDQTREDLLALFGEDPENSVVFILRVGGDGVKRWVWLPNGGVLRNYFFSLNEVVYIKQSPTVTKEPVLVVLRYFDKLGFSEKINYSVAFRGEEISRFLPQLGDENGVFWEEEPGGDFRCLGRSNSNRILGFLPSGSISLIFEIGGVGFVEWQENRKNLFTLTIKFRDFSTPLSELISDGEVEKNREIKIPADLRWSVSVLEQKLDFNNFMISFKEPPLNSTDLLKNHLIGADDFLWSSNIPSNFRLIRIFDNSVVEKGAVLIPESWLTESGWIGRVRDAKDTKVIGLGSLSVEAVSILQSGRLRALAVTKGIITDIVKEDEAKSLTGSNGNLLIDGWRLEPCDDDDAELTQFVHLEKGQTFGIPFLVNLTLSDTLKSVKSKISEKLSSTEKFIVPGRWRFSQGKGLLKDDDNIVPGSIVSIEHPVTSGPKPLTIRP